MSENLVFEHHACPNCCERRMDYLVIDETNDDMVHCYNCDTDYRI